VEQGATDRAPAGAFVPRTSIEIINAAIERGRIRHALFDFDGTVSLIREGWQGVMIPLMVELIQGETGTDEPAEDLHALVEDFVTRLTGKQTIYQMIELAEAIWQRGAEPRDPVEYKRIYLDRLWERIQHRVADLKAGKTAPDDMMVPGSREILRNLCDRGMTLYLASGTDIEYVQDEANALDVVPYFRGGVWGAVDDYKTYSKAKVIGEIIARNQLHGAEFAVFGDGYVEIENAREVGGIAVGVATNEAERKGIDEWKRNRLIGAGADIIIPDFREQDQLVRHLFAE
jgi:phosphoglycolate phosphatase